MKGRERKEEGREGQEGKEGGMEGRMGKRREGGKEEWGRGKEG